MTGENSLAIVFLAVNLGAGALMCIAGFLVRKRGRLGILVATLAWALPVAASVVSGQQARGNLLILMALLLSAANWKHFE